MTWLKDCFSQSSNPRIFKLKRDITTLTQGSKIIYVYFTILKRHWDNLPLIFLIFTPFIIYLHNHLLIPVFIPWYPYKHLLYHYLFKSSFHDQNEFLHVFAYLDDYICFFFKILYDFTAFTISLNFSSLSILFLSYHCLYNHHLVFFPCFISISRSHLIFSSCVSPLLVWCHDN